jgi:hypothetical protein
MVKERTVKEWQSLVLIFKSRISALQACMESEYGKMESQKEASAEVRKANSQNTQKP